MGTYNIHAGHNFHVPGASGKFSETKEDRNVKNKVIELLRKYGHTVYDCTDEDATTVSGNLANIVAKCNAHKVDLDVSIHFNAFNGSAHGTEVHMYNNNTLEYAKRICAKISALGYTNRGPKTSPGLYVLRHTNSKAILIECCFCDSATDANIYSADKMAKAIVEGILNTTVTTTPSKPTTSTSTQDKLYKVRKSWTDIKSQLGAYSNLDTAKKNCPTAYSVYDWNGNKVYTNNANTSSADNTHLYRVRKTWADAKSQTGAYKSLTNAKNNCGVGYTVFDWEGNTVYTNKDNSSNTNPVTPVAPIPTDVSPVKDLDHDSFIQYIGTIAKQDMLNTGILASVTIAQAILESGWGQSELSLKANNLFGMKASLSGNNWGSEWDGKIYAKRTNEEVNGQLITVLADFRAYDSIILSIRDHSNYLCNAKNGSKLRYAGVKGEKDYKKAIQIIKDGGYATSSTYVSKIVSLIEQYHLNIWDEATSPSDLEEIKKTIESIKNKLNDVVNDVNKVESDVNKL